MADNLLKGSIKIDGQQEVVNAFKIVSVGAGKLQTDLQKLSNTGLSPLAGNFQKQVAAQRSFASSLNSLSPSIDGATAKFNKGGAAVLNFSRVVQDAPFAFNNFGSIANNIDPLFESLTRLRAEAKRLTLETGKSVSTFSLFKQSLMGGAGVGLAISAVTSLITAFSIGLFDNKKATEDNTDALDAFKLSLEESKNALDEMISSVQFANKLGKINLDIDFGKGINADVLDLNAQVVGLNKSISDTKDLMDKLTLDKSGLEFFLNSESRSDDEVKITQDKIQLIDDQWAELNKKRKEQEQDLLILYRQTTQAKVNEERRLAKEAADAAKDRKPKDIEAAIRLVASPGDLNKEIRKIALGNNASFRIPVNAQPELTIQIGQAQKDLKKVLDFFQVQIGGTQRELKLQLDIKPVLNPVTEEIRIQAEAAAAALAQQLQQAMQQALAGIFAGLGDAIGAALSGNVDGIQNGFKAIINIMGTLITKIGEALIQYGIVKSGLDKIIAGGIAIPGVAAIAAGVAAVAIGSLIKNSQIQGFARGGVVPPGFPGDGFPAMLSSGEKIIPAGQPFGGGGERLITTISGTQLKVLLQRTDKSLGRTA